MLLPRPLQLLGFGGGWVGRPAGRWGGWKDGGEGVREGWGGSEACALAIVWWSSAEPPCPPSSLMGEGRGRAREGRRSFLALRYLGEAFSSSTPGDRRTLPVWRERKFQG